MMKTSKPYILVIALLMILGIPACSDNNDPTLRPAANERYLNLEADGKTTGDEATAQAIRFDLDAGTKTIEVKVTSNTLWKVEVAGGGWCSVDIARGSGDGEFSISILNNRSEERNCVITVTQIDAEGKEYEKGSSADIEITQAGSQVYITPSSLDLFPAENPREQEFEIVANTEWSLSVRAESDLTGNFITIVPIEGMTRKEGSEQTFTGSSNARFKISLQNNGMATVRKSYIELKSENGNFSVEISQQKSEYTFDVSPNTTRFISGVGGELQFDVYSPSFGWSIIIPQNSWIKCQETEFDKKEGRVAVSMTAEPNLSGHERTETIYFRSQNNAYSQVPVAVVQSGFDMTFVVSLNDSPKVVDENGGTFSFNVNSKFRWEVAKTANWMSVTPNEGLQSDEAATVNVRVERNPTNVQRDDIIKVIPLATEFASGIVINPESVGIQPVTVPVMQYGGQKPAISIPWLMDGYEQTRAELEYSYYSPFVGISRAGIQWKKASDSDWNTSEAMGVSDPHAATITRTLEGLDPATDYIARGYIIDSSGEYHYGSATLPFRTAGRYPGAGDNPTPSL